MDLVVVKDLASVVYYLIAAITGIYVFLKWIWPKISPYFINQIYFHSNGVHVIRDIEAHFGKSAGKVLKEIMQQRGLEILIDEMRLNIIENAVGIGIYIADPSGNCTYANKTLAKMFGQAQHDMLGYGWIGPIVDKQKAFHTWKFAVDNNIPYRDVYDITVNGVTNTYHAEAEASVTDNSNVVLGYVGIVRLLSQKEN